MNRTGGDSAKGETAARVAELRRLLVVARGEVRLFSGRSAAWSWSRLASFFGATIVWYPLWNSPGWAAAASITLLVLFGWTVLRHRRAKIRHGLAVEWVRSIEDSLTRIAGHNGRPGAAPSSGALARALPVVLDAGDCWTLTPQELDDLDVLAGADSLFARLNRCGAALGAGRLAEMLRTPLLQPQRISARRQAVRALDEAPESLLRMLGAMHLGRSPARDRASTRLVDAIRGARALGPDVRVGVTRVWGWVSGAFVVTALAVAGAGWSIGEAPLLMVVVVNSLVYLRWRRRLAAALKPWEDTAPSIESFLVAIREAAIRMPGDAELDVLRGHLEAALEHASLPELRRHLGWVDSGGMIRALLNVLILFDLQVAGAVLGCVLARRDVLLHAIAAAAELDALLSLACFSHELPVRVWPDPVSGRVLRIEGGRHPLLPPGVAVPNDLALADEPHLCIVTGSNMAGKSTLLRMVGVNVLLAQAGAAVAAERMSWSPARLTTDLRVTDSLPEHESYFLAEVRHLRRIVAAEEANAPVLGLIDEPFRGTSSDEQAAASLAVVEHLLMQPGLYLIATHDRLLTRLADGVRATNAHFRENLDPERGMVFDYRLRPGPAPTRNALRVLHSEQYPPSILARAEEWLSRIVGQDLPAAGPSDA